MKPKPETQTLTVEEAARILGIGRTTAYALAREWRSTNGRSGLPVLELGRSLRVPRAALARLLDAPALGVGAPEELPRSSSPVEERSGPSGSRRADCRPGDLLVFNRWRYDLGALSGALRCGIEQVTILADGASDGPNVHQAVGVDVDYLRHRYSFACSGNDVAAGHDARAVRCGVEVGPWEACLVFCVEVDPKIH